MVVPFRNEIGLWTARRVSSPRPFAISASSFCAPSHERSLRYLPPFAQENFRGGFRGKNVEAEFHHHKTTLNQKIDIHGCFSVAVPAGEKS
jgi:hypothetical protein